MALLWLGLILFTGFLMVSSWRFWSGKEINMSEKKPFQLPVVIGLVGALIAWKSDYMLMFIALGYLVSGVLARLAYSWSRSRRQAQ
jgi:CDP-diacylglycerol---serine O-phosphatidyltransferase